jgi:hypothetical protein
MVAFVTTRVVGILKFDAFSAALNVDSIEKRGIVLISTRLAIWMLVIGMFRSSALILSPLWYNLLVNTEKFEVFRRIRPLSKSMPLDAADNSPLESCPRWRSQTSPILPSKRAAIANLRDEASILIARTLRGQTRLARGCKLLPSNS